MYRKFLASCACGALLGCGGGGGGGQGTGSAPAPAPAPAPTPTPTPTPTPNPTPTPTPTAVPNGPANVSFLHVFGINEPDGMQPYQPLMQASDGNFYGVTAAGGFGRCFGLDNFCGAVIKMTPGGSATLLHGFRGAPTDGHWPSGPLIQGSDGALYGTTNNGGAHDLGTVFRITLSGDIRVLYSFGPTFADGFQPRGRLLMTSDGSLYGGALGGPNDCPKVDSECGIIFKLSPQGAFSVVHAFREREGEGALPNGSLIDGGDGYFYGTTSAGGNYACSPNPRLFGCGTVFRMTPTGEVTYLHGFGATRNDGITPRGALVRAADGKFYGTTRHGGGGYCLYSSSCGTVFSITGAGTLSIVYAFVPDAPGLPPLMDGYAPAPYLELASDGFLYGVTEDGGYYQSERTGTIFRMTLSGVKTTLYSFGPFQEQPHQPTGGVIEARDGHFYGMTFYNGNLGRVGPRGGAGTIYRMSRP